MAPVDVLAIVAKSGDLELVSALEDDDDAKMRPHGHGALKESPHFLGMRARGDVVVMRLDAHQSVAHATAGIVGDKAGVLQPLDDGARRISKLGR